jgi:adenosylhomocysteinase
MAFAEQALTTEWLALHHGKLTGTVYPAPADMAAEVARLSLASLGVAVDELSDAQRRYLSAWESPTWANGG